MTDELHLSRLHGEQGMTDEDRSYRGSRYAEVKAAVFANPYPRPLPVFRSTLRNGLSGILPGGKPEQGRIAAARAVDSFADLRWGKDGKGYRKLLHPNGVCLFGAWEITADNPYTGYFVSGSRGLAVARFSSHGTETKRGQSRSLSLVAKIYPTEDEDHADPLVPAALIVQQDLGGERTKYLDQAELRNAPNLTAYRRKLMALLLGRAGMNFTHHDMVPDVRQTYEIAELGKPAGTPTNGPEYVKLEMTPGQARVEGNDLDYRDEVLRHIYSDDGAEPTGSISFDVSVSDEADIRALPGFKRVKVRNWQKVGTIVFTEAVASYNGDHVLHFHHPGWRTDRNDPATVVRAGEKRVIR